jgi:chemotaxis protein CheX
MVCAGACSIYSTTGIKKLEISPPTLLIVDDGMVKLPVQKGITINFVADDIPVDMFIGISS